MMLISPSEGPYTLKEKRRTYNYLAELVQVGSIYTEKKQERGDQSKEEHDTQEGYMQYGYSL